MLAQFITRHARKLSAFAVTLTSFSTILSCEETKGCTLIGCMNGVTINVTLAKAYEGLGALNITVCHNDVCLRGQLEDPDAGFNYSTRSTIFPGWGNKPAQVSAMLKSNDTNSSLLELMWESTVQGDLVNGDTFSVTITSTSGEVLASGEKTVTYTQHYPNGKDCDDVPCVNAQFSVDATGAH